MKRRSLLTLLFAATIAISMSVGCSKQADTGAAGGKKTLTLVTSPDYPPYEFYDKDQKIVGFDIDIANYIAKELGLELTVRGTDFNGLIPELQSKRADLVMAGMTPTEERKKNIDFSTIYYEAKNTILAPKSSNLTKPEDLAGKKVGVQFGSIQEGDAKKIAAKVKGLQLVSLNKVPDLIQELKTKRIDAAIIENTVVTGYAASNPELAFYVMPSDGPSGSAIAFPKGSTQVEAFNKVLQKMRDNGELTKLAKKWFETAAPSPAPSGSPSISPSPSPSPAKP